MVFEKKQQELTFFFLSLFFLAHGGPGGYNAGGGGSDATDGYNDDGSGGGGGGGHFSGGGGGGAANSCGSCCDGGIGGTASTSVSLFLCDTMQPWWEQTKALHFWIIHYNLLVSSNFSIPYLVIMMEHQADPICIYGDTEFQLMWRHICWSRLSANFKHFEFPRKTCPRIYFKIVFPRALTTFHKVNLNLHS